ARPRAAAARPAAARLAGLRTRGLDHACVIPYWPPLPRSTDPVFTGGVRSRSPLRGSPGLAPGSLLPRPPWWPDQPQGSLYLVVVRDQAPRCCVRRVSSATRGGSSTCQGPSMMVLPTLGGPVRASRAIIRGHPFERCRL